MNHEAIDANDPRRILEANEEHENQTEEREAAFALGRILGWTLDARSLSQIGIRVLVASRKIRPDLVAGISLSDIAIKTGVGRSAIHKISKDFESVFGFRGTLDKSVATRSALSESWRRKNGRTRTQKNNSTFGQSSDEIVL